MVGGVGEMKGWIDLSDPGMDPQYYMTEEIKVRTCLTSLTTFCIADNSKGPTAEKLASEVLTTENNNQLQYCQRCH